MAWDAIDHDEANHANNPIATKTTRDEESDQHRRCGYAGPVSARSRGTHSADPTRLTGAETQRVAAARTKRANLRGTHRSYDAGPVSARLELLRSKIRLGDRKSTRLNSSHSSIS